MPSALADAFRPLAAVGLFASLAGVVLVAPVFAQSDGDAPELGWANETELTLAMTGGNSGAQTFGFGNTLHRVWETARMQVRVSGIRSKSSDDPFLLVDPGLRFAPGGSPGDAGTTLVRPGVEPDVENYLLSGRYDKELAERFFWNAGGSWDRNKSAGVLNRYIAFAGIGNVWHGGDELRFSTTYAVSFTNREEVTLDPDKDVRFGGARLGWEYLNRFGDSTTFENTLISNIKLTDASDYSLNVVGALGVSISAYLALRVSLQFLYENEPALEDVGVVARVVPVDPDGIPGSGDELFETVAAGGTTVGFGSQQIRKRQLDTVFRTALVISF